MRLLFEANHAHMAELLERFGQEMMKDKPCAARLRTAATVGALLRADYKELIKRRNLLKEGS